MTGFKLSAAKQLGQPNSFVIFYFENSDIIEV